jgi:UDP-N-acetylmuramoyl-tripeptide--D-alanyl-D-alanine ligase
VRLSLSEISEAAGADRPEADIEITNWSIDTRTLAAGDLFVAIRGPNRDGHEYVAEAVRQGAVAAMVERAVEAPAPLVIVRDTVESLQRVASQARQRWGGQVVGVTGSAGKTTTKDIIARMLGTQMPVGRTEGNLNNHIGVPLSILRLPEEARVAVLEMAMNHTGEVRELARIARPDVGVVTNVGHAHAGSFDSVEDVARAKRELIEELGPGGVAVLNADDHRVLRFREFHSGRTLTFGLSAEADVRGEDVEETPAGVRFRVGDDLYESPLMGRHGVLNLLAGIAVARHYGVPADVQRETARSLEAGRMRGQRFLHEGITVLDDCYNSNPEAVRAMLDVLRVTPARRRFAVLGEMLELGRWSESLHRDVGRYAAGSGINVLVGIRGAARHMVDEALRTGMSDSAAFFFPEPAEAGEALRRLVREGDAVLFKGSRGTQVEQAMETFLK